MKVTIPKGTYTTLPMFAEIAARADKAAISIPIDK
jgi:hypothetical protein